MNRNCHILEQQLFKRNYLGRKSGKGKFKVDVFVLFFT